MNETLEQVFEKELPKLGQTESMRAWIDLFQTDPLTKERVFLFYSLMLKENELQNLTRLTEPRAFFEGHFLDALYLSQLEWTTPPAMDLGSGVGVPGVLSAILEAGMAKKRDFPANGAAKWVLAESELRKAEYLKHVVEQLQMGELIEVFYGRGETFLKSRSVGSIVVRAVGSIERIYGWFKDCSTWNNLILLKGQKWDEEWQSFSESKWGKEVKIVQQTSYEVGEERKHRKIIQLTRVPRGTIKKA